MLGIIGKGEKSLTNFCFTVLYGSNLENFFRRLSSIHLHSLASTQYIIFSFEEQSCIFIKDQCQLWHALLSTWTTYFFFSLLLIRIMFVFKRAWIYTICCNIWEWIEKRLIGHTNYKWNDNNLDFTNKQYVIEEIHEQWIGTNTSSLIAFIWSYPCQRW